MDVIALLRGGWSVRRRVVDLREGVEGEFAGEARFSLLGRGLRWEERGRLRLGGYDGPAGRLLLVVPDGAGWAVEFADGRPFHPLDLTGGPVSHLCGDDVYRGEYRLVGDALDVRWTVIGPGKDQRISSSYRRSSSTVRADGPARRPSLRRRA
jgi:Family of unknown function (DUF6314)